MDRRIDMPALADRISWLLPPRRLMSQMNEARHREFLMLLSQNELRLTSCVHAIVPEHWNDAEDILQETKVKLWMQFDKFESGTDFGAWACTIARYQVRTYRKGQERNRARFSDAAIDAIADRLVTTPSDETNARLAALAECVRQLTPTSRDLLRQRYTEGKKVDDISKSIGSTLSATYTNLSRIRRGLMQCVESRMEKEPEQ